MGCFQSKEDAAVYDQAGGVSGIGGIGGGVGVGGAAALAKEKEVKELRRCVWCADPPVTAEELKRRREEFWDTQPHYGGSRGARADMGVSDGG